MGALKHKPRSTLKRIRETMNMYSESVSQSAAKTEAWQMREHGRCEEHGTS